MLRLRRLEIVRRTIEAKPVDNHLKQKQIAQVIGGSHTMGTTG